MMTFLQKYGPCPYCTGVYHSLADLRLETQLVSVDSSKASKCIPGFRNAVRIT